MHLSLECTITIVSVWRSLRCVGCNFSRSHPFMTIAAATTRHDDQFSGSSHSHLITVARTPRSSESSQSVLFWFCLPSPRAKWVGSKVILPCRMTMSQRHRQPSNWIPLTSLAAVVVLLLASCPEAVSGVETPLLLINCVQMQKKILKIVPRFPPVKVWRRASTVTTETKEMLRRLPWRVRCCAEPDTARGSDRWKTFRTASRCTSGRTWWTWSW